jgi:chemotaxis protein CheX
MATAVWQSRLEQLDSFVIESVKDVFSTMLNWPVDQGSREGDGQPAPFELHQVNGCIGFGGQMTGSLFLSCSENLAAHMARIILGADHPVGAREVSDVVGELTNMLAGGCKSRLCDHHCSVVMSIPNIIRGKLIRAASKDVKFMLQRQFTVPIIGEGLKVIALGKFDHGDER